MLIHCYEWELYENYVGVVAVFVGENSKKKITQSVSIVGQFLQWHETLNVIWYNA